MSATTTKNVAARIRKLGRTNARNLEAKFDAGEDVSDYFDFKRALRGDLSPMKRINVEFPSWVVTALDQEARRRGITRQALIKVWIALKLKKVA